jgi:hypothetical protein
MVTAEISNENEKTRKSYLLLRRMFVSVGEIRAKCKVEIDEIFLILCLIFVADADALVRSDSRRLGGASAHTISQMTDIPRETVRRKLQRLITLGAVTQDSGKLYHLKHSSTLIIAILSAIGRMSDEID